MADEKIITKLRALLAKAEGTTGAESESFMKGVRDLMVKHQIEMHTLRQEPDPLGEHHRWILEQPWMVALSQAGAEYLGCATLFNEFEDSTNIGCRLFGRQSACEVTMVMVPYWLSEVERLSAHYMLSPEVVGTALAIRIAELTKKDGHAPNTTGTDLVPIDEAMAAAMSEEKTESREMELNTRMEGRIVAEQISLSLQVGGHRKHKELS